MAMTHTIPEPLIDAEEEALWEEVDNFKKRGNWTEERHEILEKLSMEEIAADIMRIQAENPDRGATPEELREKIKQTFAARRAQRHAEPVGA